MDGRKLLAAMVAALSLAAAGEGALAATARPAIAPAAIAADALVVPAAGYGQNGYRYGRPALGYAYGGYHRHPPAYRPVPRPRRWHPGRVRIQHPRPCIVRIVTRTAYGREIRIIDVCR